MGNTYTDPVLICKRPNLKHYLTQECMALAIVTVVSMLLQISTIDTPRLQGWTAFANFVFV